MKKFAEVLNGKVIYIGTCPDLFTPEFAPPMECVVISPALDPQPAVDWEYVGGCFIPPAGAEAPALSLVIDSVTGGLMAGNEITVTAGSTLTASGRVLQGEQVVTAFTGQFRLPIRASDGRERLILAVIAEGLVSVAWTPRESGVWSITQDLVNSGQPDAYKMAFAGLKVYVLEA